jgi:hypothetical protein
LHVSYCGTIPHKLEYKTVLYYKVILRYKTVFFSTARERTSILLYKTLFYIRINNFLYKKLALKDTVLYKKLHYMISIFLIIVIATIKV